ncbi:MAG: hypothetical protein ACP5D7_05615 [Limnospira sp.]
MSKKVGSGNSPPPRSLAGFPAPHLGQIESQNNEKSRVDLDGCQKEIDRRTDVLAFYSRRSGTAVAIGEIPLISIRKIPDNGRS